MSLPTRRVKCMGESGVRAGSVRLALWLALVLLGPGWGRAADVPGAPIEPPPRKQVRLADIGWTDVTATTALFSTLVQSLGYDSQVTVLSVPVTYASMKNKD